MSVRRRIPRRMTVFPGGGWRAQGRLAEQYGGLAHVFQPTPALLLRDRHARGVAHGVELDLGEATIDEVSSILQMLCTLPCFVSTRSEETLQIVVQHYVVDSLMPACHLRSSVDGFPPKRS